MPPNETPSSMPRPVMNRLLVVLVAIVVLAVVYLVAYGQGQRSGATLVESGDGSKVMVKGDATKMAVEKELMDLGYEKQTTISGTVVSSSASSFVMDVPINGALERFTVRLDEGVALVRTTEKSQDEVSAQLAAFDAEQSAYEARVNALLEAFDPESNEPPPELPNPPTLPELFVSETLALTDLAAGDHVSIVVNGDATGMREVTAASISLQDDSIITDALPPAVEEGEAALQELPYGHFSVTIVNSPQAIEEPPLPPEPAALPDDIPPPPEPEPAS